VKAEPQQGRAGRGRWAAAGYGIAHAAHGAVAIRTARWRPIAVLTLSSFLWSAGWVLPLRAAAEETLEYEVKAAFLLNFARFVEWPASAFADANAPLAICILGKDPFGRGLDDLVRGEEVGGHKLLVRRIGVAPQPRACQIVFTQESGKAALQPLSELHGVLTVGEGESFVRDGGIIGFVIESRRVRFDISQKAADASGIKLSSKLLSVARSIEK